MNNRTRRLCLMLALEIVPVVPVLAQEDDLKKRTEELERRITELEKRRADGKGIRAEFKDGLMFKAEDGTFDAHVGGRLLTHYRFVHDRPEGAGSRSSPDTFFIRQARLEMSGTFSRDYEFKVQSDFPTGSATASGTIQDAYLGWKKYSECSIRIGQFREPFSQEELTSTRFIDFVERSVANRLVPARDIGFMLYGKLLNGLVEYEAAVFNGQGRALLDGNDEKDVAARVRFHPFAPYDEHPLKALRIGFAGTVGDVDSGSSGGLDFTTTELAIQFLDATTGLIDGRRTRIGTEGSWLSGPFSLRAEWNRRTDHVDIGTNDNKSIDMDGWTVAATWILTGEEKPLENRTVPTHPFDLDGGRWGALELAMRVAELTIDDEIFELGVAPLAGNSDTVWTFTSGLNWYLTRNFRVSPNVVFERYDDDVSFGRGQEEDRAWGTLMRFQIDF